MNTRTGKLRTSAAVGLPEHPRDYPISRPHEDEIPTKLLELSDDAPIDLDNIRVAKNGNEVVAAYLFKRLSPLQYAVEAIGVVCSHRQRGLGSWMLAHAIGMIESKGGREVIVRRSRCGFLERFGFVRGGCDELRLTLTAE